MDPATDKSLGELLQYPLMRALVERRTRRLARGTSLEAGPLSWQSQNAPLPLSELEEAILIGSLGVTGVTMHDGPLEKKDGRELGTPFLNAMARTASRRTTGVPSPCCNVARATSVRPTAWECAASSTASPNAGCGEG